MTTHSNGDQDNINHLKKLCRGQGLNIAILEREIKRLSDENKRLRAKLGAVLEFLDPLIDALKDDDQDD